MRSQGGNLCLLGECNDGYKCDCFGFEQCNISSCSIYTTDANAVPSSTVPFSCHLTPDAGKCTTFSHFLDTIAAADNAKAEASASVKEADMEMTAASEDLIKVQGHKIVLAQIFEELDTFADKVTEDERTEVEEEAEQVVKAVVDLQKELADLHTDNLGTFKSNLQAAKFHRLARRKENEAQEKESREKIEKAKPEHSANCAVCVSLKAEADASRKERKEAARLAGSWTKKTQEGKNRARKRRQNIGLIRLQSEEARAKSVDRSQRILTRLRGVGSRRR